MESQFIKVCVNRRRLEACAPVLKNVWDAKSALTFAFSTRTGLDRYFHTFVLLPFLYIFCCFSFCTSHFICNLRMPHTNTTKSSASILSMLPFETTPVSTGFVMLLISTESFVVLHLPERNQEASGSRDHARLVCDPPVVLAGNADSSSSCAVTDDQCMDDATHLCPSDEVSRSLPHKAYEIAVASLFYSAQQLSHLSHLVFFTSLLRHCRKSCG